MKQSLYKEKLIKRFIEDEYKFVYQLTSYENNPIPLSSINSVISGFIISDIDIHYHKQVINISRALSLVISMLNNNTFNEHNIDIWKSIHYILGKDEVLNAGEFRHSSIHIGGCQNYRCPKYTILEVLFNRKIANNISNPYTASYALDILLTAFYSQFFYDGNKRTARIMTTGILLNLGIGFLSIESSKYNLFNSKLRKYYNTHNKTSIKSFLLHNCITHPKFK